jgi:hypothetical protein
VRAVAVDAFLSDMSACFAYLSYTALYSALMILYLMVSSADSAFWWFLIVFIAIVTELGAFRADSIHFSL